MLNKDALEYLVEGVSKADIHTINGKTFSSHHLNEVKALEPEPTAVELPTLRAFADFIESEPSINQKNLVAIVHAPDHVALCSTIFGDQKQRATFAGARVPADPFPFGAKLDLETFIVSIQSQFVQDDTTKNILSVVGNIVHETKAQVEDDGVTQRVTARQGIARNAEVQLPNPVALSPYRTFREVEQPESNFVLRIENTQVPRISLHEADGGVWKLDAIANIKEMLKKQLPPNVTVLG